MGGFGFTFGFRLCLQGFGFAEQYFAEAGRASLLFDFFQIGALLGRADEGAVFVFVGLTDHGGGVLQTRVSCAFGSAKMEHPAVVVLRGDLQTVDEDAGAAGVDAVGGEGALVVEGSGIAEVVGQPQPDRETDAFAIVEEAHRGRCVAVDAQPHT